MFTQRMLFRLEVGRLLMFAGLSFICSGCIGSSPTTVNESVVQLIAATTPNPTPTPQSTVAPTPSITPTPTTRPTITPTPAQKTALGNFVTFETDAITLGATQALGAKIARTGQVATSGNVRAISLTYQTAGISVVVHIKSGTSTGTASAPLQGATAIAQYQQQLNAFLDQFTPVLLAIENEENWSGYFTGTAQEYLTQFNAAASIAKQRGIPVTNGAITSTAAAILTWEFYQKSGQTAKATSYASRAFAGSDLQWVQRDVVDGKFDGTGHPDTLASVDMARELLAAYKTVPIMTYLNFHWYIDDSSALEETIDYLRSASGRELVTTEIGQLAATGTGNGVPGTVVTNHLKMTVEKKKLPFVIWMDQDKSDAPFGAVALHQPQVSPVVLRPTGTGFKAYITSHPTLVK